VLTTTVLRQARELTGTGHTLHQAADQLQVGVDRLRAALRDPTEPCSPVADPVTPGHPVPTGRPTPPSPRQQP
jgi:hypothetical protein